MFPTSSSSSATTTPQTPVEALSDGLPGSSPTVVIPVIEEQFEVHTERVETGRIRVNKQVHEEMQTISVPVTHEVVDVQRVPINQVVDEVPQSRQEGDTLILPVVREEVVTSVRLVLVEEVRITRKQEQTTDQQTVTVRRETVSIDRVDPGTTAGTDPANTLT